MEVKFIGTRGEIEARSERHRMHSSLMVTDGESRIMIRKRGDTLIGHASIASQVKWCQEEGIRRAIFTHCGSQIVAGDEETASARVRELGQRSGVHASLAHDGLRVAIGHRGFGRVRGE